MNSEQTFELIQIGDLLERVNALHKAGHRLVQIGATRLPEELELTYSFDLEGRLSNLRLRMPALDARVPSISSIYSCAFLYENEMHDLFNLQVDGMIVDFHGNLYTTTVKFPFGTVKAPVVKPVAPPATTATTTTPAPADAVTPAPCPAGPAPLR